MLRVGGESVQVPLRGWDLADVAGPARHAGAAKGVGRGGGPDVAGSEQLPVVRDGLHARKAGVGAATRTTPIVADQLQQLFAERL